MERRRLLKTSVGAVAGMVVTLPGGSAFANASAFQCVYEEQEKGNPEPIIAEFSEDNYVRAGALVAEYREKGSGNNIVKIYTLEHNGLNFLEDGTEVDMNDYIRLTDQVNASVLVIYNNEIDEEGNHVIYVVGAWPEVQMDAERQNHGLTASCLASFDTRGKKDNT